MFGLFKSSNPTHLLNHAKTLFESERFGEAKLVFERARRHIQSTEAMKELDSHIQSCADRLGLSRFEEAKRLVRDGSIELAAEELDAIFEISPTPACATEAEALIENFHARAAQTASAATTVPADDHFMALQASWEDDQQEEYRGYGTRFEEALSELHNENFERSVEIFQELLQRAEKPVYLWFEIARAYLLHSDEDSAEQAFRNFLRELPSQVGQEARIAARLELARMARDREDFEKTIEELQVAIEESHDDPRPYMALAMFLRDQEHHEEALEILQTVSEMFGDNAANPQLCNELAQNYRSIGNDAQAVLYFEKIVDFFVRRGQLALPTDTTVALAELHEAMGNKKRAADLYRMLSEGNDSTNHGMFFLNAGRLLKDLGAHQEAKRALLRANGLLENNKEKRNACHQLLAELETSS